jgi:hypothetical protein
MFPQRMAPPQPGEPVEVRVGGDESASMLDSDGSMLRVSRKLRCGTRLAAEVLEDFQVARTRVDDPRIRAIGEFVHEGEHLFQGRRTLEDSWIGDDPDQAGKGEG